MNTSSEQDKLQIHALALVKRVNGPRTPEIQKLIKQTPFCETALSVRSFMGWTHIPEFAFTYTKDWERSNNPWKGKNLKTSGKVAVPPHDWLCKKIEQLNLQLVEGLPFPFTGT